MDDDRLSGTLQENVLALLCFNDSAAKLIASAVSHQLFESSVYREIAGHAIAFVEQFGAAIKEHLPDHLESVLTGSDKRKATAYANVIHGLHSIKDTVHPDYVLNKLWDFVRQQQLKAGVLQVVKDLQEGRLHEAENALEVCLQKRSMAFSPGVIFSDVQQSLQFFDSPTTAFSTGIGPLDRRGVGPCRAEMYLIVAPPKKGKTWKMIHLAKFALLQRLRVLHISLEMSESRLCQRYVQAFFSVSKRNAEVTVSRLIRGDSGALAEIREEVITDRRSLEDEGIREFLTQNIQRRFSTRPPMVIKSFPTGTLTLAALRAYLNGLERSMKFVPDLVVLDYGDLMQIDSGNLRVDTGRIFQGLRGLAVERQFAMVTATQGNRHSAEATLTTDTMVAEDYSKIATADVVVTYSQTARERTLGLARLFVANGRNDEDKFVTLITQAIPIGQFCLDAVEMPDNYFKRWIDQAQDDESE